MKAHRCADFLRKLFDVARIPVRNDDVAHLVAVRGNGFFLEATNRQYTSAQSDLTGHSDIPAYRHPRESADYRSGDSDARRRPILWCSTGRHMDVDVLGSVKL